MKNAVVVLIVIMLLLAPGCGQGEENQPAEEVEITESVRSVDAFGVVKAGEEKTISLHFPAEISGVHVREGDLLEKGEPIFSLDLEEHSRELAQLENRIEQLRQENRVSLVQLEEEGRNLLASYENAGKEYEDALIVLQRQEKLYSEGAVPGEELRKTREQVNSLSRQKERYGEELQILYGISNPGSSAAVYTGGSRGSLLLAGQKQVESLLLDLSEINSRLETSYIEGDRVVCDLEEAVVFNIGYETGEKITPGKTAFSLIDSRELMVEADVLEEFITGVREGQRVEIVPVADRSLSYGGTVKRISAMAFQKNGDTVVPVEITVDRPDDFLRVNFNVDVTIFLDE